jgi:hypothetical protein
LLVVLVSLHGAPALAQEHDEVAKSNVASTSTAGVLWLSGGVGDEAMTEMHKVATAYNVHLLLTGLHGNYLAGVPFALSRRNGQIIVSGVTEGPLLYLKLPAGNYQIAVEIDGVWQTRRIEASASGTTTKVRFVARGE